MKFSLSFFGHHFFLVFGFGLIAALGRAIQLGAMGVASNGPQVLLEILIEAARVLTFLFVLGEGSIAIGSRRIKKVILFSRDQWKHTFTIVITRLRVNWKALIVNGVVFSAFALSVNYVINKVAYGTDLLATVQNSRLLALETSEWVLILFFKNLTVIPFTIIFDGFFLRWITSKLEYSDPSLSGSQQREIQL